MTRFALFSLNDPTGCERLARAAMDRGFELLASSETVAHLGRWGLPALDIADFTGFAEDVGFPPSLHPRIELALTGSGPESIELVHVLPYPMEQGLDVGGHTLLALALKGNRWVACNRQDRDALAAALEETATPPEALLRRLATETAATLAKFHARLASRLDDLDVSVWRLERHLAEGENPYQVPAALYRSDDGDVLGLPRFQQLSGQPPCFTNLADADAVLQTMVLLHGAFVLRHGRAPFLCVAAKHGNACGAALSWDSAEVAVHQALFGSPEAVWGGEVVVNFPIDLPLAHALYSNQRREERLGNPNWMLDIVMAPSFSDEAVSLLGKRSMRKLLANPYLASPVLASSPTMRVVRGGVLIQPRANYVLDLSQAELVGPQAPSMRMQDLILAWAVAWSGASGGNEVALAKDGQLLSLGGGPSTVEAAYVAVARARRAGHNVEGAFFAADAFFPFTDAPAILVEAGCAGGVVPAGGRREAEVRGFFMRHGLAVHYLPEDKRGFCRH